MWGWGVPSIRPLTCPQLSSLIVLRIDPPTSCAVSRSVTVGGSPGLPQFEGFHLPSKNLTHLKKRPRNVFHQSVCVCPSVNTGATAGGHFRSNLSDVSRINRSQIRSFPVPLISWTFFQFVLHLSSGLIQPKLVSTITQILDPFQLLTSTQAASALRRLTSDLLSE